MASAKMIGAVQIGWMIANSPAVTRIAIQAARPRCSEIVDGSVIVAGSMPSAAPASGGGTGAYGFAGSGMEGSTPVIGVAAGHRGLPDTSTADEGSPGIA